MKEANRDIWEPWSRKNIIKFKSFYQVQSTRGAATFVANYQSSFPIMLMRQPIKAPYYVHACSAAPGADCNWLNRPTSNFLEILNNFRAYRGYSSAFLETILKYYRNWHTIYFRHYFVKNTGNIRTKLYVDAIKDRVAGFDESLLIDLKSSKNDLRRCSLQNFIKTCIYFFCWGVILCAK